MAKPRLSHRETIMALMSKKTKIGTLDAFIPLNLKDQTPQTTPIAMPRNRTRRTRGSGHEARPSTANKHGLRTKSNQNTSYSSSEGENSPREILRQYDEGLR